MSHTVIDLPAVRARVAARAAKERRMFPGLPLPQEVRDAVDLLDLVDELTERGRAEQAATAAALRGELVVDGGGFSYEIPDANAGLALVTEPARAFDLPDFKAAVARLEGAFDEDDGALDAAGETGGLTLPTEQERAEGLVPLFREQAPGWLTAEPTAMEEDLAALLARVAAECQS